MRFPELVRVELAKARSKHPSKQQTLHEGYGVLLEEVDEVWDIVKSQTPKTASARRAKQQKLLKELVQVAAMAQRTAEDLGLVEDGA